MARRNASRGDAGTRGKRSPAAASEASTTPATIADGSAPSALLPPAAVDGAPSVTSLPPVDPATTVAATVPTPKPPKAKKAEPVLLTAADRENPAKLSGDDLKALAHQRGIAKSELATMSDDKIRMQLRYITVRRGEEEVA